MENKKEDVKMNHVAMTPHGNKIGLTTPFIQRGRSFINIKDDDTFEDIDRFEWADKDKKIDGYIGVYNGHKCEIKKVDKEETDVEYIVTFEEYPGLTGGGDTIGEAVEMAKEALDMWLRVKKEDTDKREILSQEDK